HMLAGIQYALGGLKSPTTARVRSRGYCGASGFLIQRTQQKPERRAPDRKSLELPAPRITVVGRKKGAFAGSNLPEADFRTALARPEGWNVPRHLWRVAKQAACGGIEIEPFADRAAHSHDSG